MLGMDVEGAARAASVAWALREYVETLLPALTDTLREPGLREELVPAQWPGSALRQAITRFNDTFASCTEPCLRKYSNERFDTISGQSASGAALRSAAAPAVLDPAAPLLGSAAIAGLLILVPGCQGGRRDIVAAHDHYLGGGGREIVGRRDCGLPCPHRHGRRQLSGPGRHQGPQ